MLKLRENSELDLFEAFKKHDGDERIPAKVKEMEEELGGGNKKPEILPKLAQYELTLLDWVEEHRGYRKYVASPEHAGLHSRHNSDSFLAM